jgi:uncharacterized protein YciI
MLVSIIRFDNPKAAGMRKAHAVAHGKYVKEKLSAKPVFAGPLHSTDGKTVVGCMFIAEFKSVAGARLFHKGDPYKTAGLFRDVFIAPTKEAVVKDRSGEAPAKKKPAK